jgi:predicted transcriptional regulator
MSNDTNEFDFDFNDSMSKWVNIDNRIRQLNEQLSELKEEKNDISDKLNEYIEVRSIEKKTINVNLKDSQIKFVTTKIPQTLTFKYLESCLAEIIDDEDQVAQIIEYVKSNRKIENVNEIKRIYKK